MGMHLTKRPFLFMFNCWAISGCFSSDSIWIRIGLKGRGIQLKRDFAYFSERYGYRKSFSLLWGWRLLLLEKG